MSSRGGAPNCDSFRVDSIFLGIPPKPADGRLAIMDLSRPFRFSAQAVCNRGAGISSCLNKGAQTVWPMPASFVSIFPSAAMYPNDDGAPGFFGCRFFGNRQVKGLPWVFCSGVGQIAKDLYFDSF